MHHSTHHYYHATRLTELKRLNWAFTMRQLASSMTMIFVPIYLYNLHYSLQAILWLFLLENIFWPLLQYPLMKFSNRVGFNKTMGLSLILYGVTSLLLATLSIYRWPLWFIALVLSVSGMFFYPNFRACFAKSLLHRKAGLAVGVSAALTTLAYGIAPAIGGAVASSLGVVVLYAFSIALFVAAALPLFGGTEIIKNAPFNLRDLDVGKVKRDLLANFSDTIDDSILSIIWPLFIFLLIPSYVDVGILSSISVIAGILIAVYVGRREELQGARKYLKRGSLLTTVANAGRLLSQSAPQIAGVNFVNGLGHALLATPFFSRYYENASREPLLPYIYAMMVVSAVGGIMLFGILLIISYFVPIQTVLLVGLLLAIPASFAVRLIR